MPHARTVAENLVDPLSPKEMRTSRSTRGESRVAGGICATQPDFVCSGEMMRGHGDSNRPADSARPVDLVLDRLWLRGFAAISSHLAN
jgi:hypothetical protein